MAKKIGYDMKTVRAAIDVNRQQRRLAFEKIEEGTGNLKNKTIGILGLSFKPNTDDMRDAPSIAIIEMLQQAGARIKAYDPVAMNEAKRILQHVVYSKDAYDTAKDADGLVFMTEWNQFRNLDTGRLKKLMKTPVIIDLRNIYEPQKMKEQGFKYVGRIKSPRLE
jgi:UDPglucose 6-dehydrogenase